MAFTLTWTGPNGSDKLVVATATEALSEYEKRVSKVVRLTVKDNHGRKLTHDDLYQLDILAEGVDDA